MPLQLSQLFNPIYPSAPPGTLPGGDCGCGSNETTQPAPGGCDSYANPPLDLSTEPPYSGLGDVLSSQRGMPGYNPLPAYTPNPTRLIPNAYMSTNPSQIPVFIVKPYSGGCAPKPISGLVLLPPTLPVPPLYNKGATVQFYDQMQSGGYEPCAQFNGMVAPPAPQGFLSIG